MVGGDDRLHGGFCDRPKRALAGLATGGLDPQIVGADRDHADHEQDPPERHQRNPELGAEQARALARKPRAPEQRRDQDRDRSQATDQPRGRIVAAEEGDDPPLRPGQGDRQHHQREPDRAVHGDAGAAGPSVQVVDVIGQADQRGHRHGRGQQFEHEADAVPRLVEVERRQGEAAEEQPGGGMRRRTAGVGADVVEEQLVDAEAAEQVLGDHSDADQGREPGERDARLVGGAGPLAGREQHQRRSERDQADGHQRLHRGQIGADLLQQGGIGDPTDEHQGPERDHGPAAGSREPSGRSAERALRAGHLILQLEYSALDA